MKDLAVRRAEECDIPGIVRLVNFFAAKGVMLPRDAEDIRRYLGNFCVAEFEGEVIGCAAARDFGGGLFEVRSLAVAEHFHRNGAGGRMVSFLERRISGGQPGARLFALTVRPEFFERLGFERVGRELFPEKIWSDCVNCPKRECCDEIAVMKKL